MNKVARPDEIVVDILTALYDFEIDIYDSGDILGDLISYIFIDLPKKPGEKNENFIVQSAVISRIT